MSSVTEPHGREAVRVRGVRQGVRAVQQPQAARAHRAPQAALALRQQGAPRAPPRQRRAAVRVLNALDNTNNNSFL